VNGDQPGLAGPDSPTPNQRSVVDSIVYTFPEPVIAGTGAFTITQDTDAPSAEQSSTLPTLSWTAIDPAGDDSSTQWSVTFSYSGEPDQDSILNGVYKISAVGPDIFLASSPATPVSTGTQVDIFYRFFGDFNGDQEVSTLEDESVIESADGTSPGDPLYNEACDPTGSGATITPEDIRGDFNADLRIGSYYGFTPTI
jgi:hypothetical protein